MGDHMIRTSLLVQRGYLCECCGQAIDQEYTGASRSCEHCLPASEEHVAREASKTTD